MPFPLDNFGGAWGGGGDARTGLRRSSVVTASGVRLQREGELNLIDLCGSECIKKSGSHGLRAREAGMIGQVMAW